MQKLGRMTLEQLTEIAGTFGIKVRRNASLQSIIYVLQVEPNFYLPILATALWHEHV